MRIFAGCDGGGSKTTVRIAVWDDDRGQVIREARGEAGPSNVAFDGELAMANIKSALATALKAASRPPTCNIDRMIAALAGAGQSSTQREWEQRLQGALPVRELFVVPDAAVLFTAAGIQQAAIALVVGTGSIAWARDDDGATFRAGGLGPLLGDEGSGYWIGLQAIRRCAEWLTEGSQTKLISIVLKKFMGTNLDDLIRGAQSQSADRSSIASLCGEVFRIGPTDSMAAEIIAEAAEQMVSLLIDASTHLGTEDATLPWVCAGGVAVHQPEWLQTIHQACAQEGLFLSEPILVSDPVDGALKLAMRTEL